MAGHIVLLGYGTAGRHAGFALSAGTRRPDLVVVDPDPDRLAIAAVDGARIVLGRADDPTALHAAAVHVAEQVIVAAAKDWDSARATSAARQLNRTARIITAAHDPSWYATLQFLGADQVVLARPPVGYLLGRSALRSRSAVPAGSAHHRR